MLEDITKMLDVAKSKGFSIRLSSDVVLGVAEANDVTIRLNIKVKKEEKVIACSTHYLKGCKFKLYKGSKKLHEDRLYGIIKMLEVL